MLLFRLGFSAIVICLLFALPTLLFNQYLGGSDLRDDIASFGFISPLVFIVVATAANVLPPVAVLPFWIVGVTLFGSSYGYVYIFIANTSASIVNYYLAERFGRHILGKFLGQYGLTQIDRIGKLISPRTIFYLRLVGGSLTDYISYSSGLVKIDFKKYLIASVVGGLPMLLFAFFIVNQSLNQRLVVVAGLVGLFYLINYLVSLLIIPVIIKHRQRK